MFTLLYTCSAHTVRNRLAPFHSHWSGSAVGAIPAEVKHFHIFHSHKGGGRRRCEGLNSSSPTVMWAIPPACLDLGKKMMIHAESLKGMGTRSDVTYGSLADLERSNKVAIMHKGSSVCTSSFLVCILKSCRKNCNQSVSSAVYYST